MQTDRRYEHIEAVHEHRLEQINRFTRVAGFVVDHVYRNQEDTLCLLDVKTGEPDILLQIHHDMVRINRDVACGQADIPSLFAINEATYDQLHGAVINGLMSIGQEL